MAIRQEGNTYYGLSTDTKPTGAVLNGREFKEMDTGKKYLFDAENGEWLEQPEEGGGGGGGSSTLSGLTDVDISNPSDGQTLVYNATTQKWENGAGGGGGGMVVPYGLIDGEPTLMAPAGDIFNAYTSGVDIVITLTIDGYGVVEARRLSVVGVADDGDDTKMFVVEPSSEYIGEINSGVYSAVSDADYPVLPH